MDEDKLNIEIRKFLKKVGITSQREIENYVRKKFSKVDIKNNQSIEIKMELSSNDGDLSHTIKEKIDIN
jgi:16S rRNA U516 pseudouridylate synthase RsuA-like enzyme